jgi:hypothetical protein
VEAALVKTMTTEGGGVVNYAEVLEALRNERAKLEAAIEAIERIAAHPVLGSAPSTKPEEEDGTPFSTDGLPEAMDAQLRSQAGELAWLSDFVVGVARRLGASIKEPARARALERAIVAEAKRRDPVFRLEERPFARGKRWKIGPVDGA